LTLGVIISFSCLFHVSAQRAAPPQEASFPQYNFRYLYSAAEWTNRVPKSPAILSLLHRRLPLAFSIVAEKIDLTNDVDSVTLAKIFKANREVVGRFVVLKETPMRAGPVDGMGIEVLQKVKTGDRIYQLHWTACFNGVVYQLLVTTTQDDRGFVQSEGAKVLQGFDLLLDRKRKYPLLQEADVPRSFVSGYSYEVNLPDEKWVRGIRSREAAGAELIMYTRNQGGLMVLPINLLGEHLPTDAVFEGLLGNLSESYYPDARRSAITSEDGFETATVRFNVTWEDEETGKYLIRLMRKDQLAYLVMSWMNTNANLPGETLDQWQKLVKFAPDAPATPPDPKGFSRRERLAHCTTFTAIGGDYFGRGDFENSSHAFRTALECNYQADVLGFYVQADLRRQKPEETLKYLEGIAYFAQRDPNFLMERAYVQAACGQSRTALVAYSKLLTASSAGAEALPRRHFTEYLRCALKEDRRVWAENALAARLRDEDFPEWRTLLDEIKQGKSLEALPALSATATAPAKSPGQPGAVAPTKGSPLKVQGIFYNPQRPAAMIAGKHVETGDTVEGYKVEAISPNSVILKSPKGETVTLTLERK
jgi:tetratricopeptide (TPR) repeat protein